MQLFFFWVSARNSMPRFRARLSTTRYCDFGNFYEERHQHGVEFELFTLTYSGILRFPVPDQVITIAKLALPYRFKGSGNPSMAPINHHHRSTTKTPQKSFKSKHASKGAIKELSKGMSSC